MGVSLQRARSLTLPPPPSLFSPCKTVIFTTLHMEHPTYVCAVCGSVTHEDDAWEGACACSRAVQSRNGTEWGKAAPCSPFPVHPNMCIRVVLFPRCRHRDAVVLCCAVVCCGVWCGVACGMLRLIEGPAGSLRFKPYVSPPGAKGATKLDAE